jgi:hypothetical protein
MSATIDAFSQQFRVSGVVDDGTGVVPGATVTLTDASGSARQAVTDAVGAYHFDGLHPGTYDMTVARWLQSQIASVHTRDCASGRQPHARSRRFCGLGRRLAWPDHAAGSFEVSVAGLGR